VGAQVLNFLVLVYLLKRFLYGPIIRAMDKREKNIALRLEDAEMQRAEAKQETERYEEKNRELDGQKEALLSQIKEEAEASRKQLMEEARKAVDTVQADWYDAIQRQQEVFLKELRHRAGTQTCAIARKALKDLASADLEDHIVRVFIRRLQSLDEEEHKALTEAIRASGNKVTLRTAFEIPEKMAQEIVAALPGGDGDHVDLRAEISSDVICGIELKARGRKIAWNLADYLEALEEAFAQALDRGAKGRSMERGSGKQLEQSPE
jgi:F-type H+-transporting ATPase subunit b